MTDLTATPLDFASVDDMTAMLVAAGLPVSDLAEPGRVFFQFDYGHGLAGFGGIEGAGPDRLLRSLVVAADRRGDGLGRAMLAALEARARGLGVARLHLLTTTAAAFFAVNGYVAADRGAAPTSISASREFTALCPASAAYLIKVL